MVTSDSTGRRALHLYVCLMRAATAVSRRIHGHLAEDGLSESQFAVLEALLHLGPLCQRDLGRKILRQESNMTTVIDNLERDGLVRRRADSEDRRRKQVHLTPRGRRLIRRVFRRHARIVEHELACLAPRQQDLLASLCRTLGRGGLARDS